MAARWRYSFYKLVPSWLSTGDGEKVLFSLGIITDAFIEKARRALTARFPTYSAPTGLKMLGAERGIVQGRTEANAGFARRLREWRGPRGHLVRGTPFAMLRQIWNYFGNMACDELDTGGNVYSIASDGTETATHGGEWNWDQSPPAPATPAHDASAASDTGTGATAIGDASFGIGVGTLTLHCDGTPGRLIFLNLDCGLSNSMVPVGDGWTLLRHQSAPSSNATASYEHFVYYKIVGPYELFTTVTVTCTNVTGLNNRFIGRAVNVPGIYHESDVIYQVDGAVSNPATTPTVCNVPALAGGDRDLLGLLFVGSRVATYAAATGGWVELDAERVAGSTGVGVDEQTIVVPETTGTSAGTITLGTGGGISTIVCSVKRQTPQDWFRFWIRLQPSAANNFGHHPTLGNGPWGNSLQPGRGYTLGQTGVTPGDVATMKGLFRGARPWKLAGTRAEWAVVVLDPGDTAHAPDGTWENWTSGGVPSRYAGWRYWKL